MYFILGYLASAEGCLGARRVKHLKSQIFNYLSWPGSEDSLLCREIRVLLLELVVSQNEGLTLPPWDREKIENLSALYHLPFVALLF